MHLTTQTLRKLLKKPTTGSAKVPTTTPRSSRRLPFSQQVSGSKAQLWHAAKLRDSGPWPVDCIQMGSDVHQLAFSIALIIVSSNLPHSPCLTRPPSDPSESPEAVYIRTPYIPNSLLAFSQYILSRIDELPYPHSKLN